jgi:hypothetical protein
MTYKDLEEEELPPPSNLLSGEPDPVGKPLPKVPKQTILGLKWDTRSDTYSVMMKLPQAKPLTQRVAAQETALGFDPIGFVSPCFHDGKKTLQKMMMYARNKDSFKKFLTKKRQQFRAEAKEKRLELQDLRRKKAKEAACPKCIAGKHLLVDCKNFMDCVLEGRWDLILEAFVCPRCLAFGHDLDDCNSNSVCRHCRSPRHHSRLHSCTIGWDTNFEELTDPIAIEIVKEYKAWRADIEQITEIQVPRVLPIESELDKVSIVGFSDGSDEGYGCVLYKRVERSNGSVEMALIMSKSRLAPSSRRSIPDIELMGALLLAEVYVAIKDCFIKHNRHPEVTLFCDNIAVLWWLKRPGYLKDNFKRSRVVQILHLVPASVWQYVQTLENPADWATKGIKPGKLKDSKLWWNGPEMCHKPFKEWSKDLYHPTLDDQIVLDPKQDEQIHLVMTTVQHRSMNDFIGSLKVSPMMVLETEVTKPESTQPTTDFAGILDENKRSLSELTTRLKDQPTNSSFAEIVHALILDRDFQEDLKQVNDFKRPLDLPSFSTQTDAIANDDRSKMVGKLIKLDTIFSVGI